MRFKEAFIATRPWSFSLTFVSISAGAILALNLGRFSFWIYACCLVGAVLLHAAANTFNDYFDSKNNLDSEKAPTALYRPHPVLSKICTLKSLFAFSCVLLWGAVLIGLSFSFFGYKWLWLIILAGIILAVFYTGSPLGLKYIAVGELTVFLAFGPLAIEGSYAAQAFQISSKVFFVSIPLGLLAALVLLSNNIRDIDFDAKLKVKTLPIILGKKNSLRLFNFIVIITFLLIVAYIICGILKIPALIIFLSLPPFIKLAGNFSKEIPKNADAQTSQITLFFGLLFLGALLVEKRVSR